MRAGVHSGSVVRIWPCSFLWLPSPSSLFGWLWGRPGGKKAGSAFSSSLLYGCTPHLVGGSNSSDINTEHFGVVLRLLTDVLLISGGARTPRTSTQTIGVVLLRTPPHHIKSPSIRTSWMPRRPFIPQIRQLLLLCRRSRPRFRQAPSPLLRRQSLPKVTLYSSPTLGMGGLGGAFAPSNQQLRCPSQSLCAVHVQLGGVLNSIPSLKHTHPSGHPHHALAGSCHRLNMGGSLKLVAVSPPLPSLPQLGMGCTMAVLVVGPRHLF